MLKVPQLGSSRIGVEPVLLISTLEFFFSSPCYLPDMDLMGEFLACHILKNLPSQMIPACHAGLGFSDSDGWLF